MNMCRVMVTAVLVDRGPVVSGVVSLVSSVSSGDCRSELQEELNWHELSELVGNF